MHPLLGQRRWLLSYFTAWLPLTAILVTVLVFRGDVNWEQGIWIGFPLGLAYALLGIPVFWVCRANPLRGSHVSRATGAHIFASLVYGTLWLAWARLSAAFVETARSDWDGVASSVWALAPMLFALGMLFYLLTAATYYLILASQDSRAAERSRAKAEVMAKGAELRALKAQINPHFLFNSLNTISSLTLTDPDRAREACVRLADFLRQSMGQGDRRTIPLKRELELVGHYLAVERVRLGDRLRIEQYVEPEAEDCGIPPLLLQPLVENAILHGVATLSEGGVLRLLATRAPNRLRILVENPYDPNAPARPGSGLGLANVRQRVETQFGEQGRVEAVADGEEFRVILSLPVRDAS